MDWFLSFSVLISACVVHNVNLSLSLDSHALVCMLSILKPATQVLPYRLNEATGLIDHATLHSNAQVRKQRPRFADALAIIQPLLNNQI